MSKDVEKSSLGFVLTDLWGHYRDFANEVRRKAQTASDETERANLLREADIWERLTAWEDK